MKYSLGLDLGVASLGWALMRVDDQDNFLRIENCGVHIFEQLENPKDGSLQNVTRRIKRGQRRLRRRKQRRIEDLNYLIKNSLAFDSKELFACQPHNENIYLLKVKGLSEKLSKAELARVLHHYVKYRGYKSNRKIDDEKKAKTKDDEGQLLAAISAVSQKLEQENLLVSEYIVKNIIQGKEFFKIRNGENNYTNTFTREMYAKEINKLLDTQIKYKLIDNNFKEAFLSIWGRQRNFAEGPGMMYPGQGKPNVPSPYGVMKGESLINKMIGTCVFDGKPRAPKTSLSAEKFVLLFFLNNLRINIGDGTYRNMSSEEIKKVYEKALTTKSLTYKAIFKLLNLEVVNVKGLEVSKKKYVEELRKYKEKNNLQGTGFLSDEQMGQYRMQLKDSMFASKIPSLTHYHDVKKVLMEKGIESSFIDNQDNYDEIASILLVNKTDDMIKHSCQQKGWSKPIIEAIQTMNNTEEVINLSIDLCKKINPFLLQGMTYDKAMEAAGYNHSDKEKHSYDFLPAIDLMLEEQQIQLSNVTVRHMLYKSRQLINAIIRIYGKPNRINVELSRELKQNFDDRRKTRNNQLDNAYGNEKIRQELLAKYPHIFSNLYAVKHEDIVRYRLWKEQKGISPYSMEIINEKDIFNREICEIDHIIPYSKSFDDSYRNKTLVLTKSNQNKKNQTPYEFLSPLQYAELTKYLQSNYLIMQEKKDQYLLKEFNSDDFIKRNNNDTSYAARMLKNLIENYLNPDSVMVVSGRITSELRLKWGLMGMTHSIIDPTMQNKPTYLIDSNAFLEVNNDCFTLHLIIEETGEHKDYVLKPIIAKKGQELKDQELAYNEMLEYVINHQELVNRTLNSFSSKDIIRIYDNHVFPVLDKVATNDDNTNNLYGNLNFLLGEVISLTKKDNLEKNRDNHLHHVVDAITIACTTQKMIQRVTKYYQEFSHLRKQDIKKTDEEIAIELGFVNKNIYPIPYQEFREDVKNRVYQRDYDTMYTRIHELKCYQDVDQRFWDNLTIIYPSRTPLQKTTGALHKETFFGKKFDPTSGQEVLTSRVNVQNLNSKTVETIFDKDKGNNAAYKTIKAWIDNKKPTTWPKMSDSGREIRKIKIIESLDPNSRIQIKEKRFAGSDMVYQVEVYQKHGEERLYFTGINAWILAKRQQHKPYTITLAYGQGSNYVNIDSEELSKEYKKVVLLPKYSLIELQLTKGEKGLAYSAGYTSGMLKVYSVLGDDTDIIKEYGLRGTYSAQNAITISTINKIVKKEISILGLVK